MKRSRLISVAGIVALALMFIVPYQLSVSARTQPRKNIVYPTIPKADRHQKGKVFLEHADLLTFDQNMDSNMQVLIGNVQFRKGDMFMYCDSARFNEKDGSLDAYGSVRMEQGDTLFVYGDFLFYNGQQELAELRGELGKDVRLINRDVTLTTDVFFYDLANEVGFYETGGKLTDKQNQLTSMQGFYYPNTKDAFFYLDVKLQGPRKNDTLFMYTDSLTYNTGTGIAQLMCPTLIVNKDGEINGTAGTYNTRNDLADLYDRATVHTRRGNTLTGDTLVYDRIKGFGEAFGNMILTDSAKQSSISGDYGFYNELKDSAFVTGRALAKEYSSKADTLYLHSDTIVAYMLPDSTKITNAFRKVRFFRSDIQGICDSMSMTQSDSVLYMYDYPIIWNGDKQIMGNIIWVHLNDSTADWARMPQMGLVAEHIEEDCYNQMMGKDMTAWMNDTVVQRVYAEGNIQVIMFPQENDSTYNKYSYVESSYLNADFEDGQVQRVKMWPETTGSVTPLYLAKRSAYFLPKFRWYDVLRPLDAQDVMDYPPEMEQLISSGLLGVMDEEARHERAQAVGHKKDEEAPEGLEQPMMPEISEEIPNPSLEDGHE